MKPSRKHAATALVAGLTLAGLLTAALVSATGRSFGSEGAGTRGFVPVGREEALFASVFPGGIRTLDGRGNNLRYPEWGRVNTPYVRYAEPNYADGVGAMVDGPSPRYVSNRVFNDLGQNLFSENNLTQWGWVWGQFLDHTFGLRERGDEPAMIPFDPMDPLEGFANELGGIDFQRTPAAPGTGIDSPREQINQVSSFIDAWAVYGGTADRLEWLRVGPMDGDLSNNGARLVIAPGGYLPRVTMRGDTARAPSMELQGALAATPEAAVVAGDVRANENLALTSVHTLFVREHNRIVDALPSSLPEKLKFEIARRVVGAEQQLITYTEFLPSMGVHLDPYEGYDSAVNAGLSNEFAALGYRAHSMIHGEFEVEIGADRYTAGQLEALSAKGVQVVAEGDEVALEIPLGLTLGNPSLVPELGLGPILSGLGAEVQYRNDEQIDDLLRSVLFQVPGPEAEDPLECLEGPGAPGCFTTVLDLGAVDIQRGRDHGMPFYNDLRAALGLPRMTSFSAITGEPTEEFPADPTLEGHRIDDLDILEFVRLLDGDGDVVKPGSPRAAEKPITGIRRTTLAARLKAIYGDVDHLDAFVGMMAEPHLPGSELGELQHALWKKQFEALRDGDRFFYPRDPSLPIIEELFGISYRHTLAELIVLNTDLEAEDIQPNVFFL